MKTSQSPDMAMGNEYTRDSIQIARLEERMATIHADNRALREEVAEVREQLEQVLKTLNEARGGWQTLMWIAGAAASAGGIVAWLLERITIKI